MRTVFLGLLILAAFAPAPAVGTLTAAPRQATPPQVLRWGPRQATPPQVLRWGPRQATPPRVPRWGPRQARGFMAAAQASGYKLDTIAEGVLLAVPAAPGRGAENIPVIVTDRDVVLVGSHFSAAAARTLIGQLKTVTDKPVRFIVNTHYHISQNAPKDPYPAGVEVIGHELARRTLLFDGRGRPRPANSAGTPPTLGMTTRLSLYRGDREIRILYLGRGHSDSDLVVFLPKERILCPGELYVGVLPDMSDGSISDWVSTLELLKTIDFQTVLPARGVPFRGKDKASALESYLRDVLAQTTDLLNNGVAVEETAKRVDLTPHRKDFPEIHGPGVDVNAVRRLKTQLDEPEAGWGQ